MGSHGYKSKFVQVVQAIVKSRRVLLALRVNALLNLHSRCAPKLFDYCQRLKQSLIQLAKARSVALPAFDFNGHFRFVFFQPLSLERLDFGIS